MLGTSRAVAALLASALVISPAFAQPEPTAQQKQQAGDLVKQAIAKSQAKDHLAAIELYLKAYAIVPLASLLSNVGAEYQHAKKPVEALRYFCMYLEKDATGTLSTYATAQAKVLEKELGDADEATVCQPVATAPIGDPPENTNTTVTGTQDLSLTATPAASDPGKTLKLTGLIVGGAGVLGLGLGIYFGLDAKSISDKISNQPTNMPWPDGIKDLEADGQRAENLQVTFLIAGSVLAIGGGVAYMLGRSKTKASTSERLTVSPTLSPDGAGVALGRSF